ncbi:MAG: GGDEF domain-containing protein [Edaphobacter sp.]
MESTAIHNQVVSEIERLSGRRFKWLTLPESLEDRFERDTAQKRAMRLWHEGLIAIVLYDLFAIADYWIGDGRAWNAILLRLAVITPLALLVNASMRWKPWKVYRETSIGLVICLVGLIHLYLEAGKGTAAAAYAQVGVIVAILFANVVMRLRFPYALGTSVALLLGDLFFLRLDRFLSSMDKGMGIMLAVCAGFITLVANYSIGREERLGYLMLLRNEIQSEELAFVNAELHRISSRDNLTGLANRHSFESYCEKLWKQAAAANTTLSAILIDIDKFKAVNDLRGHLYGDKVLTRVASLLQQSLRGKDDFAARFGGEEFVVLLPAIAPSGAIIVAERIRKMVEVAGSPAVEDISASPVLATTVSCGVATCLPGEAYRIEDLLEAADKAMYEAKRNGRNRVCCGEVSDPELCLAFNHMVTGRIGAQSEPMMRARVRKVLLR